MEHIASVIIYKDQAYVPIQGLVEEGPFYLCIEPVTPTNLDQWELAQALLASYEFGNPVTEAVDYKEYQKLDPILKASKARSWKQLAKQGASYGIEWLNDKVTVYMSKLDSKGRFVDDLEKQHQFSSDVDMEVIASVILEDYSLRDFG